MATAEKETSKLSLKLSSEALGRHRQSPEGYIDSLIEKAAPDFSAEFKATADPLVEPSVMQGLAERVALAAQRDATYTPTNFEAWYRIQFEVKEGGDISKIEVVDFKTPAAITDLIEKLITLDEVESVHALHVVAPPAVQPDDDPRSSNQGYLNAAPSGVDARFAWTIRGGDGTGANVVDLEQGWLLNHEDLAAANITLISGTNTAYFSHGTGVLGVLLMVDNRLGGIGMAPSARGRVVSSHGRSNWNVGAILDAIQVMNFGDVLLLEAQTGQGGPIESEDDSFEAIRMATALGITVIEAAGNGSIDMDTWRNPAGRLVLNRNSPDFRESGAVMVGAGTSTVPHSRHGYSTFGNRIDVFAWGDSIDTATTDDNTLDPTLYTTGFNGTSGASAIVAGTAVLCQSISNALQRRKLSPTEARRILMTSGTPTFNPAADRIGNMPNLRGIIQAGLLGRP